MLESVRWQAFCTVAQHVDATVGDAVPAHQTNAASHCSVEQEELKFWACFLASPLTLLGPRAFVFLEMRAGPLSKENNNNDNKKNVGLTLGSWFSR